MMPDSSCETGPTSPPFDVPIAFESGRSPSSGDSRSEIDVLLPLVYDELHALARRELLRERIGHTLQPTALIHEVYLKLAATDRMAWRDRAHFLASAVQAIRRILVDHARTRDRQRRGGGQWQRVPLDTIAPPAVDGRIPDDLIAIDEAIGRLAEKGPRQARLVELRFFGGLSVEEAAEVLDVSPRTAAGDWVLAKAWLRRALGSDSGRDAHD